MGFTYELSAAAGRVRLLVPDNDSANYVFDDNEIDAFLALEGDVRRAAALALETIASNEALTLKVIRLLDVQTDGRAVSDALLKRAAALRKQADDADMAAGGAFDVAEMVFDDFSWRERWINQTLRAG
jgi:hypothetical protein